MSTEPVPRTQFEGPALELDFPGLRNGVAEYEEGPTGCTVFHLRPGGGACAVDVRGGSDDAQDFYCPAVEWEWGDETKSTNSEDCEPYQPGKSQIQRRYSMEHIFNESGSFNVRFRLKQGNRVVANTSAVVHVRPGLRDEFDN